MSPKRGSIRRQIRINANADEIYALIGDPLTIPTWFPGIVEAKVDGRMRVIKTNAELEMPEEILTNDFISRRFQYKITSPMFQEHLSTIDVIELGPSDSLVVYGVDAVPAMFGLAIAGGASGALLRLKEIFEGDKNG